MTTELCLPAERLVHKNGKNLRSGYTTGSCAALAAGAATRLLLTGKPLQNSTIFTPGGVRLDVGVEIATLAGGVAECAVRKDAGDDPDVTDGILVHARVGRSSSPGIHIDGGEGVGRVARPGLDQPVGAAAINSVPRQMIARAVREAADAAGYAGGLEVIIAVPDGARLAEKTFNPRLGVVGGISVIGTTGIVHPMSDKAVVDTVAVEMRVRRAEGDGGVLLTPGNLGDAFARSLPALKGLQPVKCANFIGEALDLAKETGFDQVLLAGHVGKLIKVSGGIMDTHSRVADCRLELLALHAARAGAGTDDLEKILDAATTDAGMEIVDGLGLREAAAKGMLERIDVHLRRRLGAVPKAGAVLFGSRFGLLGVSPAAGEIMGTLEKQA